MPRPARPRPARPRPAGLLVAAALVIASATLTVGPPAAASSVVAAPSSAATGPVTEWGVVPADASGPDGRVSLRHAIDPGATVRDAIAVTNHSADAAVFVVAAGDGIAGADGAYDVRTDDPVAGGSWVSVAGLDDGSLALAAGETRVLPVAIGVPADATPGDHPAGIVVALSSEESGVTVTHRVGVRMHLQVTGEIAPSLRIDAAAATFEPSWQPFSAGTLRVEYRVTNTGNVRFGASADARASGILGALPAAGSDEVFELLPGGSATRRIDIPLTPLFFAAGEVLVTPVSLGDDRAPLPEAASSSFSSAAVPWSALILAVGTGAVLAAVILLVVRARGRTQRRIAAAAEAAVAADRARR
ncbi:hypothetical protein [Microbacterium sp. cf332]|uniref:COG1470 family protein n=1 Tax=Microbacterium sp. cf332 TaxID=1761804 RepID=UPI00087EF3FF|nr:hypothetical protein [Microbacterium sp. cf332]SDQ76073.1 hypothetical protein SAMN04487847_2393 [Microbacterium sp. cf332]